MLYPRQMEEIPARGRMCERHVRTLLSITMALMSLPNQLALEGIIFNSIRQDRTAWLCLHLYCQSKYLSSYERFTDVAQVCKNPHSVPT